ncbi:MAG TPA: uracil-DNA glycosylase [Phycisphaerae bacterium]|nr:uracil-DNA glycosylase [Phycisphaerae bacterium]
MADVDRLVRQWLETDAAFGVAEVPLPAVRVGASVPAQQAARPASPPPVAAAKPAAPARPVAPTRPAASTSALIPAIAEGPDDMPRRKAVIEMPAAPAGDIASLPPITRRQKEEALAKLLDEVTRGCKQYINEISTRLVFGEGDPDAQILFVGEGPGIEEDRTGRPFVGRSGQLLDKMIVAMGFQRDPTGAGGGVYIANVVKLRCAEMDDTTGRLKDRPPTPEEAARGLPILHKQIEIIRPRVIVTLGAPAIKYVTGTTEGVMKIRGTWHEYRGIPVMPTYHPSFLLRAYTEENRRKVWGDLKLALTKVNKPG